jgi:hypothetical protein
MTRQRSGDENKATTVVNDPDHAKSPLTIARLNAGLQYRQTNVYI